MLSNLFMGLGLNLSYTFSGHTKLPAHFFKRVCYTINKSMTKL